MTKEQLTDSDVAILRMQFRTTMLFQYLRWDSYYRRIGQVLLGFEPGTGTTIHGISRVSRIPRKTVRRKLTAMIENGLVQKNDKGHYSHTEHGRSMHIRTWKDVMAVARGEQKGLSRSVLTDLSDMPTFGGYDFPFLENVEFDDSARIEVTTKARIAKNRLPVLT